MRIQFWNVNCSAPNLSVTIKTINLAARARARGKVFIFAQQPPLCYSPGCAKTLKSAWTAGRKKKVLAPPAKRGGEVRPWKTRPREGNQLPARFQSDRYRRDAAAAACLPVLFFALARAKVERLRRRDGNDLAVYARLLILRARKLHWRFVCTEGYLWVNQLFIWLVWFMYENF